MTETEFHSRPLFAIYGASGCGRSVFPIANAMLAGQYGTTNYDLVFVDDRVSEMMINGHRVVKYHEFVTAKCSSRAVCIAIADSQTRRQLSERCRVDGIDSFTVIAPNVVIMDDVEIGDGAVLSPFVTLTSNVRIGRHFHANLYSYVEHDCVIGDYVTFAPGVHCNGNVTVEDHAYLGSGCIIRQGRPDVPLVIGCGATIGMGAVVTQSVPTGATVVGNPARPLRKD